MELTVSESPTPLISSTQVVVRDFGLVSYQRAYEQMREFTGLRDADTPDEFWLMEHGPVFTLGYSCTNQPHSLSDIPIVPTDRGGQITYHGPGQLVIYLLVDLRRRQQGVRHLVRSIELAISDVVESFGIACGFREDAPGVYVDGRKIASLGIRVSRGCTYHGLSLNVEMDTKPFGLIDVCGIRGLEVTTLRQLGVSEDSKAIADRCVARLSERLAYESTVEV